MPAGITNKTLRDGTGATFSGAYYDDGDGRLFPISLPVEIDDEGTVFVLVGASSVAYDRDGSGNITAETMVCADGVTRARSYTRDSSGAVTSMTGWEVQD